MNSDYLNELLRRMCDTEVRAVRAIVPEVIAVPRFFYHQESFPYFTHRIDDNNPDEEVPQDQSSRVYTAIGRLVVAHLAADVTGEFEELLYRLIPLVEDEFESNMWLLNGQSDQFEELSALGVTFTRSRGMKVYANSGIGVQQIGTEFSITAQIQQDRYGRYG